MTGTSYLLVLFTAAGEQGDQLYRSWDYLNVAKLVGKDADWFYDCPLTELADEMLTVFARQDNPAFQSSKSNITFVRFDEAGRADVLVRYPVQPAESVTNKRGVSYSLTDMA
jgi:hypothetical protein